MRRLRTACALAALVLTAALVLAAHASGSAADTGHVHAVAFDPADGALLLGTHDGLYRLGALDVRPRKVGNVSYDLMGLAVLGPRSYVASGHPDAVGMQRDGLPANLGLIRSDDGGRSWRPVSLHGDADFHVLRARGKRIFAFDVVRKRLLASTDAGRHWKPQLLPERTADLDVGPVPGSVVASTVSGIVVSTNGGAVYARRAGGVGPGFVSWPSAKTLVLVDGAGTLLASSDGGRRFTARSGVGGRPVAIAASGTRVAVLLETGAVRLSLDGGRSFRTVPV